MEIPKDKKKLTALVNEVKRYEEIADYFRGNPKRLTERNKDFLEEMLYRLYDIEGIELPEQVKEVCSRTLKYLTTKLDDLV